MTGSIELLTNIYNGQSTNKASSQKIIGREMKKEVVFIPWPVMGHVQIVEFAKLIVQRQTILSSGATISITVLVMKLPDYIDTVSSSYADLLCASSMDNDAPHVNFVPLPPTDPTPEWSSKTRGYFIHNLVRSHESNVADYIRSHKPNVIGLVADMLCTSMIGIAEDLSLPSYVFFASPASFLGAMLHCQTLHDEKNQDVPKLRNSESDLLIPSFSNPVPPNVLSLVLVDKQMWLERFLHYARDYRRANGIIVNTFFELESYALNSLLENSSAYGAKRVPPVYPVGPILNRGPNLRSHTDPSEVLKWLDEQPESSVVFVCLGSQGSLCEDQVRELARGLERSGFRFLWSLRRQSPKEKSASFPSEYTSYREVLPQGFLDRTDEIGKVVGWVPQLDVLHHVAVGGFVSHCGWNSVLESLWCGVPIATWPLHAEQQMNAFQLVRELGLAVEITLSYHERSEDGAMLTAGEIERGIREVMDTESEVRRKVKEMREFSRMSVTEGGSSYESLAKFTERLMTDVRVNNVGENHVESIT